MALMKVFEVSDNKYGEMSPSTVALKYLESDKRRIPNPRRNKIKEIDKEITQYKSGVSNPEDDIELRHIISHLEDTKGLKRKFMPFVLNPEARSAVKYVIDTNPHKHKYSSGVLSYSHDDTKALAHDSSIEDEYRSLLESFAFSGIDEKDRFIYWVRHTDNDRVENHFIIPRICFSTTRAFNAFPPGSEYQFNVFTDYLNLKHGLSDPSRLDTPSPKRAYTLPLIGKFFNIPISRSAHSDVKKCAYKHLYDKIRDKKISNYPELILYLYSSEFTKKTGLECFPGTRQNSAPDSANGYITVFNKDGELIRLRGFAFTSVFTNERKFTSRVDDGRMNETIRANMLKLMKKEMQQTLTKREAVNTLSAYGKHSPAKNKTSAPTVRKINNFPRPPALSLLLTHIYASSRFTSTIVVPELSETMSDHQKELAIGERNAAISEIKSKQLREQLSLDDYHRIYTYFSKLLFGNINDAYYPGTNYSECSYRRKENPYTRTECSKASNISGARADLLNVNREKTRNKRHECHDDEQQGCRSLEFNVERNRENEEKQYQHISERTRQSFEHAKQLRSYFDQLTEGLQSISRNYPALNRHVKANRKRIRDKDDFTPS